MKGILFNHLTVNHFSNIFSNLNLSVLIQPNTLLDYLSLNLILFWLFFINFFPVQIIPLFLLLFINFFSLVNQIALLIIQPIFRVLLLFLLILMKHILNLIKLLINHFIWVLNFDLVKPNRKILQWCHLRVFVLSNRVTIFLYINQNIFELIRGKIFKEFSIFISFNQSVELALEASKRAVKKLQPFFFKVFVKFVT